MLIAQHIAISSSYELVIITCLGLILGSFATALADRIPKGVSWAYPFLNANKTKTSLRSACPKCGHKLGVLDLFPILSWVFLKGKCRHCKHKISPIYPTIELTVLLSAMGVYLIYGFSLTASLIIFMLPFLIALLIIDFRYMILPDQLVLTCAIFGIARLMLVTWQIGGAHTFVQPSFIGASLGGAIIYGTFAWGLGWGMKMLLKKDALGFGDVKFFMMVGLWLGIPYLGWFCILSGVLGVAIAAMYNILKPHQGNEFPFGPALILSFYVLLLIQGSHFL